MDDNAKKFLLRMIPYGLYVLGTGEGEELGMATINWVTQTSFGPPLLVMAVKNDGKTHDLLKTRRAFALSMLKTGQKDQAYAFFKHAEPEGGKINGFAYSPASNGCPTLDDAAGYVAGEVTDIVERGDHSVFVCEVKEAVLKGESEPLTLKEIGANYGG